MEKFIVERVEVDDVPYGKFKVRVPCIWKHHIETVGIFFTKTIEKEERFWLYLDEEGRAVDGWNHNSEKVFETREDAEIYVVWWKARQEKIKNESPL